MQRTALALALAAAVIALTLATPSHATFNACSAAKKMCVALKAAAILKCHSKNEKPPGLTATKFAACVQKAKDKFDGGSKAEKGCFAKLEAKFSGSCLTTGDTAAIEAKVDAFLDDLVCELDAGSGTCPATPTPTATPPPTPTPIVTSTPSASTPTATATTCVPSDPDPCGTLGLVCGSAMDSCGFSHSCGVCAGHCCGDSCVCNGCPCL